MSESLLDTLHRDGKILQLPSGVSMWPLLKNKRDAMIIQRLSDEIRPNDVVLFRRTGGQLVLHRVITVKGNRYYIRGDNCSRGEYVDRAQIHGILTGIYKKGRLIDCRTSMGYRAYVLFCRATHYIRIPLRVAFRLLKRGWRRICRRAAPATA